MVKLTSRLKAAADLCRRGVTVCDVGTDHALLACYLAQTGAGSVIASDVKEGPLDAARRTIAEQGVTNVTAVLSDGLDRIDYADDVVICGMGGELIMRIISGCRFLSENTHFILQPMTKADTLRRELCRSGFEIAEERAVREGDRFYAVMLVKYTGVRQEPDELFCLCGRIVDPDMLRHIAGKLLKNAAGMETSGSNAGQARHLHELAEQILAKAQGNCPDGGTKCL